MNTTTTPLRLTAAASIVALAVTLAGCATAEAASAGESRAQATTQVVVTPAMHRALVRSAADRYVSELLVRARMAQSSSTASVDVVLTRLSGL